MRVRLSYYDSRTAGMDDRIMMRASFTSQMVDAHSLECSMTTGTHIMSGEVTIERNEEIPPDRSFFPVASGRRKVLLQYLVSAKDHRLAEPGGCAEC